jgi:hypothetical protein
MRVSKGALGLAVLVPLAAVLGLEVSGCSADTSNTQTGGSGGDATTNAGGNGGAGGGNTSSTGGSGVGGDIGLGGMQGTGGIEACVATEAEATLEKKPVDIIFIIDNSGSMGDNIESVQNNINANFAAIIGASGIDYRVIMISEHGGLGDESICVGAPLSTTNCMPVPNEPGVNAPIFYQYSVVIGSHDSYCRAVNAYNGTLPDQFGLGVGGWKQWLRTEAFKVFVEVTDDGTTCTLGNTTIDDNDNVNDGATAAQVMDGTLLALDPAQFGTAAARNYVWHSIIGLAENNPPTAAYQPGDALVTGVCGSAVASGTAYQVLSQITGGLRFPICQFASFDVVFQEIAKGVIAGAKVECEFPVPPPPDGETIDLATVVLEYTPGDGSGAIKMEQVKDATECKPAAFYIENDIIKLCPDACTVVQDDGGAKISILFGCENEAT